MREGEVQVAVFAKAPIPGQCKTRLIPRLGPAGAAALQARLVERTLRTALAAGLGPVSLWCAPDRRHPFFAELAALLGIALHDQRGQDLGDRMLDAFARLTPAGPVLLVGTDCPVLDPGLLAEGARRLCGPADAVFLPAEDGGYALVGLRAPVPELFAQMPWGSDRVMAETRVRAARLGLALAEPATVWDLDRPEDYERARALGLVDPV